MWALLMLIILLTNGMSAFGLKVIAGWALPESVRFPYLSIWYAAGLVSIGLPMLLRGVRLSRREVVWGAILAVLSMAGQLAMAAALAAGVPGHVVFPVAIGGSVLLVALVGAFCFGERLNRVTTLGVISGFLAVVLLSVS